MQNTPQLYNPNQPFYLQAEYNINPYEDEINNPTWKDVRKAKLRKEFSVIPFADPLREVQNQQPQQVTSITQSSNWFQNNLHNSFAQNPVSGWITKELKNMNDNFNIGKQNFYNNVSDRITDIFSTPKGTSFIDNASMYANQKDWFPVSTSNLLDSRYNFAISRNNPNAHVLNSVSDIKNKGLNSALNEILQNAGKDDSRGVLYGSNSVQSHKLWNSPIMQQYVKDNYDLLKSNQYPKMAPINFGFWSGPDNYLGLQNAQLYNAHITPDGYFDAAIADYYDFKKRYPDTMKNTISVGLNNWGKREQDNSRIKNYFTTYQIHEKVK